MPASWSEVRNDAATGQPALTRQCDGCGATMPAVMETKVSPAHWGVVWFCDDCVRTQPASEIERRTREIALCGVPLA
jgi:hypothetical protein